MEAVYFDDQLSGHVVANNTFRRCVVGVQMGGGRRLVVEVTPVEVHNLSVTPWL